MNNKNLLYILKEDLTISYIWNIIYSIELCNILSILAIEIISIGQSMKQHTVKGVCIPMRAGSVGTQKIPYNRGLLYLKGQCYHAPNKHQ